jgi:hypothetical protein
MKALRIFLLVLLSFSTFSFAQEETEETEPESHDYSRPTLLFILSEEEKSPNEPDTTFEYHTRNWTFRWLPFLTPIVTSRNFGNASIMGPVDPFSLLGMEYPETADTYPDRGEQSRFRKRMVRTVHAANRADKARRLSGGN